MNIEASPWSPRQRRWLHALGHVVLRRGGGEEDEQVAGVAAVQADVRVHVPVRVPAQRSVEDTGRKPATDSVEAIVPRPAAQVPVAEASAEGTAAPAMASRGATRRPARLPDRLQLAMLRASGLDPAGADAQAAMAQWPMEQLRGDAAAKRAFWPQLRALRKQRP